MADIISDDYPPNTDLTWAEVSRVHRVRNGIYHREGVIVSNKLAPGRWRFTGYWRVVDSQYVFDEAGGRMVWRFTLARS